LLQRIERVGPTEATVLIQGERGTGKELVAAAVHEASRRRDRPYITLNCAALPVDLLASELFGHERGAFTGALERRPGLLAAADTGTVFLDEIGDLSIQGQAALLRFLQEREVRPLGATHAVRVDVRIIAATNRDLASAVRRGECRADLYDRISDVVLTVPPLRERREDILALAESFVADYGRRHGATLPRLSRQAARALVSYDWPGNVRELEKAISRSVIFADGRWIAPADFDLPLPEGFATEITYTNKSGGFTGRQRQVLRLASGQGTVARGEVMARFALSGETVRRDLVALMRAGVLKREGHGRRTHYRAVGLPDTESVGS
jgi:transcriptional regulator with GAF, ATPase, and Fis domain